MHSGPRTVTQEENDEQREIRVKAVIAALNIDRGAVRLSDEELVIALENAEKTLTEILAIPALAAYAMVLSEQLGIYYGYHPRNQKKANENLIHFKAAATAKLNTDPNELAYARACMYLEHAKANVQDKDYYDQALKTAQDFEKLVAEEKFENDEQIIQYRAKAINNIPGLPEYAHACMYSGYVGTIQGSYHDERLFVEALAVFNNYQKKLAAQNALTPEKIAQINIEKGYIECFLGLQIHRKSYLVGKTEEKRIEFLKNAVQHLVAAQKLQGAALDFIGPVTEANRDLYLQVTIELANTYHIQGVVSGKMSDHHAELAAYQEAMKLEAAYEAATGRKHFLTFVTMQNYSLTLTNNFNRAEEALAILKQALADQLEYYKDKKTGEHVDNFDIAKTHHYTGMVLAKLGRHAEAAACFQQSYDMKIRLGSSRLANEVLDSQTCLFKAIKLATPNADIRVETVLQTLKSIDMFNWTDYKTIKPFEKYVEQMADMTDLVIRTIGGIEPARMQELLPTLYQLGAFYVHVPRNAARAHQYLATAMVSGDLNYEAIDKDLYAWILNHSAFVYQQMLSQSFGKPIEQLRLEYNQHNPIHSDPEITEQEIRDQYFNSAILLAGRVIQYESPDRLTKYRQYGFATLIMAYADYERQRFMTDRQDKRHIMADVVQQVARALSLYEAVNDLGEQYLRAKNRYADLISELVLLLDDDLEKAAQPNPLAIYQAIEVERKLQKTDKGNIWAGRFYYSFGKYLDKKLCKPTDIQYQSDDNISYLQQTIEKYAEAHVILAEYEGAKNSFTLEVLKRKITLQLEFAELIAALDPVQDQAKKAALPSPALIYAAMLQQLAQEDLMKDPLAEKVELSLRKYLQKSGVTETKSDTDDVKLTATQQSQALNTGSTTTDIGLFANSLLREEQRLVAAAAKLLTPQTQTRPTGPGQSQ